MSMERDTIEPISFSNRTWSSNFAKCCSLSNYENQE